MKSPQVTVSRETFREVRVGPLLFRRDMREATAQDIKHTTRRILAADNCKVQPGTFTGLILDTGRARRNDHDQPELRAQCKFPSGVRVVTVTSKVEPGDLFWVKPARFGARRDSTLTLEVTRVGICRIQDMRDEDAVDEGIALVKLPAKLASSNPSPRERFAWLWDSINGSEGPRSWKANPWVWVYQYKTFPENIDAILARWESRP